MDWKILAMTFGIVFLAELGDKSQVVTLLLTGKTGNPLSVFLGATLAIILVTLLAMIGGEVVRRAVPEKVMSIASAVLFLVAGVFFLIRALLAGNPSNGG